MLIVDTAGRLAIDEAMMQEVAGAARAVRPIETLFVVDSMLGQDAVNTAKAFGDALPLTGVILTKLDGDARGGAALSVRTVTGRPVKFIGVAEKIGGLERFDPERMAGRVLGMGDIVALVEDVQSRSTSSPPRSSPSACRRGERFDMNDFKEQLSQMRKMGGLSGLLDKLPATAAVGRQDQRSGRRPAGAPRRGHHQLDDTVRAQQARPDQGLAQASHRSRQRRAGAGSNRLLNQFEQMQAMMKQMRKGGLAKMMRGMGGMKGLMGGMGGMPGLPRK